MHLSHRRTKVSPHQEFVASNFHHITSYSPNELVHLLKQATFAGYYKHYKMNCPRLLYAAINYEHSPAVNCVNVALFHFLSFNSDCVRFRVYRS